MDHNPKPKVENSYVHHGAVSSILGAGVGGGVGAGVGICQGVGVGVGVGAVVGAGVGGGVGSGVSSSPSIHRRFRSGGVGVGVGAGVGGRVGAGSSSSGKKGTDIKASVYIAMAAACTFGSIVPSPSESLSGMTFSWNAPPSFNANAVPLKGRVNPSPLVRTLGTTLPYNYYAYRLKLGVGHKRRQV